MPHLDENKVKNQKQHFILQLLWLKKNKGLGCKKQNNPQNIPGVVLAVIEIKYLHAQSNHNYHLCVDRSRW